MVTSLFVSLFNLGASEILMVLFVLGIYLVIFLALRGLFLWYFKINILVSEQQRQALLIERQNELIEEQTALLKSIKLSQGGSENTTTTDRPSHNPLP